MCSYTLENSLCMDLDIEQMDETFIEYDQFGFLGLTDQCSFLKLATNLTQKIYVLLNVAQVQRLTCVRS